MAPVKSQGATATPPGWVGWLAAPNGGESDSELTDKEAGLIFVQQVVVPPAPLPAWLPNASPSLSPSRQTMAVSKFGCGALQVLRARLEGGAGANALAFVDTAMRQLRESLGDPTQGHPAPSIDAEDEGRRQVEIGEAPSQPLAGTSLGERMALRCALSPPQAESPPTPFPAAHPTGPYRIPLPAAPSRRNLWARRRRANWQLLLARTLPAGIGRLPGRTSTLAGRALTPGRRSRFRRHQLPCQHRATPLRRQRPRGIRSRGGCHGRTAAGPRQAHSCGGYWPGASAHTMAPRCVSAARQGGRHAAPAARRTTSRRRRSRTVRWQHQAGAHLVRATPAPCMQRCMGARPGSRVGPRPRKGGRGSILVSES